MLQKRLGRADDSECGDGGLAAAETARSAAESAAGKPAGPKDEEHMSLFWRVFGGTILSIAALVAITLFNNMSGNIQELRGELNREREARAELVKKDEFNSRTASQYDRIRSFEGLKAEHEGLKERAGANAAAVEGLKKDVAAALDSVKKDAAALEVLKERVAGFEAVRKDVAGIELLKERVTLAAADLRAVRDDVTKIQQEVERNKTGDMERKTSRDAQYRSVEEAIKELQKGLQDCREKLARLEGAQPATRPVPADPQPRPIPPAAARPWLPIGGN